MGRRTSAPRGGIGVSGRFGVEAVDKGVRAKRETRNTKLEERRGEIEARGVAAWGPEGVRVQNGKELAGAVGAGRVARGDFTGHDSAG